MRILLITGSWCDGQCGVGDYTARLADGLSASAEVAVVASGASVDAARGATRTPGCRARVPRPSGGRPCFELPPPRSVALDDVLDWLARHGDRLPRKAAAQPASAGEARSGAVLLPVKGFGLRGGLGILRAIARLRPDVVHLQYPSKGYRLGVAPLLVPLVARLAGARAPVVVTLHEFSQAHALRRAGEVFLVGAASELVVPSEEERRAVARIYRRRRGVRVIPIGSGAEAAPAGEGAPPPALAGLPAGEGLLPGSLFHYGHLHASKGVDRLLEALPAVARAVPEVRLYLAGHRDVRNPEVERLERLVAELGVGERVVWLGFLSDDVLRAVLARMELAVFPFRDGFSTRRSSLLAALGSGTPVVTTQRRPGFPLLAAPPDDARGLADRLIEVLTRLRGEDGPQLRGRLAELQRGLARFFGFDRVAEAHLALYDELLSRAPREAVPAHRAAR